MVTRFMMKTKERSTCIHRLLGYRVCKEMWRFHTKQQLYIRDRTSQLVQTLSRLFCRKNLLRRIYHWNYRSALDCRHRTLRSCTS